MSASQARLLSITARLSDNELRTQTITTAKMSLANKTSEASSEYIKALDETELQFATYDDDGNKMYENLTGTSLTEYGILKNQYGIVNPEGQIMVSEKDAGNYLESASLGEFLEKYDAGRVDIQEYENPKYIQEATNLYGSDWRNWVQNGSGTQGGKYEQWQNEIIIIQGREPQQSEYGEWIEDKNNIIHNRPYPQERDYMIPDPNWVAPEIPPIDPDDSTVETWSLYEAFMNGTAGGCFSCSSNPSSTEYNKVKHFNHTLAHMLVKDSGIWAGNHWWTKPQGGINGMSGDAIIMGQIAKALEGKTCCGETSCNESHDHNFYGTDVHFDCGNEACDGSQLISDKILNLMKDFADYSGGSTDKRGDDNDPVWIGLKQRYYHLIEHDLKGVLEDVKIPKDPPEVPQQPWILDKEAYEKALKEYEEDISYGQTWKPDVPGWEAAHAIWQNELDEVLGKIQNAIEEFEKIPPVLTKNITVFTDKDKAQWYVNLWHRMNGASQDKVQLNGIENGNHNVNPNGEENTIEGDNIKSPTNGLTEGGKILWTVLEDGLMKSDKWLKFALDNGFVTLERVNYTNPTEEGTGLADVTWTSIIYTNATDIKEQENERKITQAEVKYKQTVRNIESKDKQYDNILKLLDTEHSALQTEYDSVKGVINKNIERTLKIYS